MIQQLVAFNEQTELAQRCRYATVSGRTVGWGRYAEAARVSFGIFRDPLPYWIRVVYSKHLRLEQVTRDAGRNTRPAAAQSNVAPSESPSVLLSGDHMPSLGQMIRGGEVQNESDIRMSWDKFGDGSGHVV